jgi:catechol 2,3-dioxygenase-like lactoylglutathione lyase family enzyme
VSEWGVIPSIRVRDLDAAVEFYVAVLEFRVERRDPEVANASLERGGAHVMLEGAADFYGDAYNLAIRERLGTPGANALYLEAPGLGELYVRVQERGARIVDPLADRPWGQAEFTVEDPAGNWLTFWEQTPH